MEVGVKPALPSSAENAIEKQPACAAAINSSGFVPTPFSKRVLNEYCVCLSVPLSVEMLPLPLFKSPCQTADALRFINFLSMIGTGIRSSADRQLRRPVYQKPELLAESPNQVWSWDITKLMGPVKWSYFYLYVIIDIFSRRIVGWHVADAETAALFKPMFDDAIVKHNVAPGQLTLHADRGGPMKAKATALLLADLGVPKSHSRPYTSNDTPFSESHFKTLKYQPQFPQRFGCIQDAKTFCRHFFTWYNRDHHHLGIGLMTPDQVHYGQTDEIYAARQTILDQAFQ